MAAAAAWDVLEKAADVAQLIAMLVAVFTSLHRVQQSNKRRCAELERCTRRLRALLLQWPATGSGAALLCSEMGGPVIMALGDAARLVDSYKQTTLWRRVRSGGRMAAQLRDMQDVVVSYCGLLIFMNAHLLLQQQAVRRHHIPPSPDTTIHEANDDTSSRSPSAQAVAVATEPRDDQRANEGGTDTEPAATGCERDVPALLPTVISHA